MELLATNRSVDNIIMRACFVFLIATSYCIVAVNASTVVVDSPFGKIQGVRKTDENSGQSYMTFYGIPYAKPPVGELRFAKPQPHPAIDGVFDATKDDKIICPHPDLMTFGEQGFTEDCLILNIQVKDIDHTNALKKVVVFIHGGGFTVGTSIFYDAKSFVISQNVIVVTINYRIGVLGFLSTENEASPGNYGLWDQTLAIRWVKDNIQSFGGDPHDITIAGESAGGASVGYQAISPHTKGLFSKAYPQSGTATSVFGRSINAQSHALVIAKSAGCWEKDVDNKIGTEESKSVIACLRKAPVSVFTAFNDLRLSKTQFVPTVDGDFVPDFPAKLLQDDDYLDSIGFFDRSYLIAVTNNEIGIMDGFLKMTNAAISMNNETTTEEKENAWKEFKKNSRDLYFLSRLGESGASAKNIVGKIEDFYSRRFINDSILMEMVADLSFLIPSLDFLSAASRRKSCSPYFLYFNHFPNFMKGDKYRGSPHGLDLAYWFDIDINMLETVLHVGLQGQFEEDEMELKRVFSSIIGGFMKTGNPGVALKDVLPSGWPKYDDNNSYYLNFNPRPWVSSFLEKDKQDLWFKIVPSLMEKPHMHTEL